MTIKLTIHPMLEENNFSPYQLRQPKAYDVVNNDFMGKGGIEFKSVFDVVNPLQQLPVVSSVYREVSGDTISTASRLVGGALFGGVAGFAAALINEVVISATGSDIASNIFASASDKYKEADKL